MLTAEALAARRAYKRNWAKQNADKVRAQQERYWARKAQEMASQNQATEADQVENVKPAEPITR